MNGSGEGKLNYVATEKKIRFITTILPVSKKTKGLQTVNAKNTFYN